MAIAVLMEKCKQLKMWQEMFYNTCKVRPPHTAQSEKTDIYSSKIIIWGLIDLRNWFYLDVAVCCRRRWIVTNNSPWYCRGTLCSTRNSENFETGTNSMKISWESFQKIWKWLNFWKANYSVENSRKIGRKSFRKEIFDKKFANISVHLTSLPSLVEILELLIHSSLEISGNSNQIFNQMESAPGCQFGRPWPITSPCKNKLIKFIGFIWLYL